MNTMTWEPVDPAKIELGRQYLVKTNADEWGDFPIRVMLGTLVLRYLDPQFVRGRPQYVAKIIYPE